MKVAGILLAGGVGGRFGSTIPKAFMSLNGKAVFKYSLEKMQKVVDMVVVVSSIKVPGCERVDPGNTRSGSVKNAVDFLREHFPEYRCAIIHDGVRPYAPESLFRKVRDKLEAGFMSVDTAAEITDGLLQDNVPISKSGFSLSLTPEGFSLNVLGDAFAQMKAGDAWQDEVSMVHDLLGIVPHVIETKVFPRDKLTFESDLADAEGILKFRGSGFSEAEELERFDGRRVMVIGGTGGIGKATCELFQNLGAEVFSFGSKFADLTKPEWVEKLSFHEYGIIVHAAGTFNDADVMAVNFWSCVDLLETLEKIHWTGNVVLLSSTAATYGRAAYPRYCASKAALNSYVESVHERLGKMDILVNCVAPAKTATELQRKLNPDAPDSSMIDPRLVAERVVYFSTLGTHGEVDYFRKGFDK